MKLIVQVPCYNEEKTLPAVINSIPTQIPGVDVIETMIIDDGSKDGTIMIAEMLGVDHIVRHKQNEGLAASFADGLDECLKHGADIIVNTDGDNQYPQQEIGRLIEPILRGTHDMVIGDRQVQTIEHFSPLKKFLQRFGTGVVQTLSGVVIADAPSGFRAYSREAALSINVISTFSYTIETIIQAGMMRIAIAELAIATNPKTRESRLFKSMFAHVRKSMMTMLRIYIMYSPFKVFLWLGLILLALGLLPFIRMVYLSIVYHALASGHIQSLIFGASLLIIGFLNLCLGIIADLLAINRTLIEETLYRMKKLEYSRSIK
ncbi:MAG: hypothetical protein QOG91_470 [Candidatus Parcubacteria bacterium]|nr:hypothetical protein [Candidatus Parcubacteria bacterium]